MSLRFLHTNDFHGHLDNRVLGKLKELRESVDLYFDSGDIIKAGNLAIPLTPDPAWKHLANDLNCTASVPGNRESHVVPRAFDRKMEGRKHPVVCANLRTKDGQLVLPDRLIFEKNGLRIGVFGVMVPMVTAAMKSAPLSAYLWEQPIPVALRVARELRSEVDLVIGLTHIGYRQDVELAQQSGDIDIILGGHSHTVLEQPERHGSTFICQGGSHGRFAGVYEWNDGEFSGQLVSLK